MKKFDRWIDQHPIISIFAFIAAYLLLSWLVQRPNELILWWEIFKTSLSISGILFFPLLVPATWSYWKVYLVSTLSFSLFYAFDGFFIINDAGDSSALIIYLGLGLLFGLIFLAKTFLERNRKVPSANNH